MPWAGASRRLLVPGIIAACALVGAGLGLIATSDPDDPARVATPTSTSLSEPTPSVDPSLSLPPDSTAAPTTEGTLAPASTVTTRPPPAPVVPPPPAAAAPEGLGDPAVVARRFATAYYTWRWDEPDNGPFTRARPYITDKFAAQWAQSSSGAAYLATRRARHEVQTPTLTEIYEDPEQKGLWHVQGTTTTTTDGAPPKTEQINATLIILDRAGWRVDSLEDL